MTGSKKSVIIRLVEDYPTDGGKERRVLAMNEWQKAHDPLKLLPLYDIPIINGQVGPKSVTSRAQKQKNPFIRFVKKIVSYKPTTFIGTNIMVAVMTVLVQNAINRPIDMHKEKHQQRTEHRVSKERLNFPMGGFWGTNRVNNFMTPLINVLATVNINNKIAYCENCGALIQYPPKTAEVTCLKCQKVFKEIPLSLGQNQAVKE